MKRLRIFALFAAGILTAVLAFAAVDNGKSSAPLTQRQILKQYGFIDEDGDGINDLARDADHDGIPNCVDPDWVRPQDGTGYMNRYGYQHQHKLANQNAVQADGSCHNFNYNYNYNYTYNHQWQNSGGDGNPPDSGNPGDPDPNLNRNRRSNRKH